MPDSSFEKKVSDKLNEFGLAPTNRVWEGVESHLHGKKKRDRWLLWMFFGLLLLGGGGYLLFSTDNTAPLVSTTATTKNAEKETVAPDEKAIAGGDKNNPENPEPGDADVLVSKNNKSIAAEKNLSSAAATNTKSNQGSIIKQRKSNRKKEDTSKDNQDFVIVQIPGNSPPATSLTREVPTDETGQKDQAAKNIDSTSEQPNETTADVKRPDSLSDQKPIAATSNEAKKKIKEPKVKKGWQFGIVANVGLTELPEALTLGTQKAYLADNLSSPNFGSGGVSPAAPPVYYPYSQEQSYGWGAGAWVRKDIGKKSALSAGVQYQFYSTTTRIGYMASGNVSVNNGYSNFALRDYFLVGESKEYINKYHLVQVPLEYRVTFGKNNLLPVSLLAGIQPGIIVGSNALIKDSSGILYTDKRNFNRFQLGINAGIQLRLLNKTKMPLDIGPVFQYQLTDAFRKNVGYSGHLLFVGFQADWQIFNLSKKQRR